MTDPFDFEAFKQAAIKGLFEGKPLTGEQGLFARQRPTVPAQAFSRICPGRRAERRPDAYPSATDPPDRAESP